MEGERKQKEMTEYKVKRGESGKSVKWPKKTREGKVRGEHKRGGGVR